MENLDPLALQIAQGHQYLDLSAGADTKTLQASLEISRLQALNALTLPDLAVTVGHLFGLHGLDVEELIRHAQAEEQLWDADNLLAMLANIH